MVSPTWPLGFPARTISDPLTDPLATKALVAVIKSGGVNVLYGSAAGLQAAGSGGPDDQLWGQDSPGVEGRSEEGDRFGNALAAGDFNRDGFFDLAIGVFQEDTGGHTGDGGVNVLYGSAARLQATGSGGPDDQLWGQDSPGVLDEANSGDGFGSSLSTATRP